MRRRPRFSLRFLLLAVAAVSLLIAPYSIWQRETAKSHAWGHLFRHSRHILPWNSSLAAEDQFATSSKSIPITTIVYGDRFSILGNPGRHIISARLVGPRVDDTDLAALASFPELRYLELIDASVSEDAVSALQ